MSNVRFFEKVETIHYQVTYKIRDGVYVEELPHIIEEMVLDSREILLENPPTEPLPVIGSVVCNEGYGMGLKYNNLGVHYKGRFYKIDRVDYNLDLGGEQHVYLRKYVKEYDTESLTNACKDYKEHMKAFMEQLISVDYRVKQFVKENFESKKVKDIRDIITTIAYFSGIDIVDLKDKFSYFMDNIDKSKILKIFDDDTEDCDYLNLLCYLLKPVTIDENLHINPVLDRIRKLTKDDIAKMSKSLKEIIDNSDYSVITAMQCPKDENFYNYYARMMEKYRNIDNK